MERDFKGIWIPKEIWLDDRLNALEKMILMEIDSLDTDEKGCYATNDYIAEFCQCTSTKVSLAVKKLVELEYIEVVKFDGRRRLIKSRLENNYKQTLKKLKADFKNINALYKDKRNIERNIEINNNNPIIPSSYFDNEELDALFKDFLSMRKKLKAVNSERAITVLINKLSKYDDKTKIKMIENSIENSWKGVYEPKEEKKQTFNHYKTQSEREKEVFENFLAKGDD